MWEIDAREDIFRKVVNGTSIYDFIFKNFINVFSKNLLAIRFHTSNTKFDLSRWSLRKSLMNLQSRLFWKFAWTHHNFYVHLIEIETSVGQYVLEHCINISASILFHENRYGCVLTGFSFRQALSNLQNHCEKKECFEYFGWFQDSHEQIE